jgi:hypothetical protein
MNDLYPVISVPEATDLDIHGVVVHAVKSFKG